MGFARLRRVLSHKCNRPQFLASRVKIVTTAIGYALYVKSAAEDRSVRNFDACGEKAAQQRSRAIQLA